MANRDYSCGITMSDLLFNMLLAFVAMFTLAFAQMNVKKQENNIQMKADFLITVTWPKELDDDVDVYVEDPAGSLVCFRRREDGLMHLDRDDLGKRNDQIRTAYGVVQYEMNREIVTIRGAMPGEYIINLHMFRRNSSASPEGYVPSTEDCPVTVQIDQLNPYSIAVLKTVVLKNNGEEQTVVRFNLEKDALGKFVMQPTMTDVFKSLATSGTENAYGGPSAVQPSDPAISDQPSITSETPTP